MLNTGWIMCRVTGLFRLFKGEAGVTSTEYAILLTLILGVCTTAINCLGQQTASTYQNVGNSLQGSGS